MPTGVGVIVLTLPVVVGSDRPTGSITLPMFSITGQGGMVGSVFEIPVPKITASGAAPLSIGIIQLPVPIVSGSAIYPVIRGDGSFYLPLPVISGGYGFRGSGSIVIPIPAVLIIPPNIGIGSFILPVPDYIGFGRLIPVSEIYKGIVMNLSNQAISTYNSFPFESLGYFDGHLYGANENGIYLLEGNKDGANYIQSKIKTGPLDFGNDFLKHLRDIWLTYRSDGHLAIVLATKEDESDRTEEFSTEIAEAGIHEERVSGPRGLRGRYYMIEIKNLSGSDFDLEQISIVVDAIRKRIR